VTIYYVIPGNKVHGTDRETSRYLPKGKTSHNGDSKENEELRDVMVCWRREYLESE
jgi:hypothetical protein